MRRPALVTFTAMLVFVAYYCVLFTNWGRPYHGGTFFGAVTVGALEVLAAAACLEVVRTETRVQVRAIAGAVGAPLALVVLMTVWYGLRTYFAA